jgi:hypothetical protein
MARFYGNPTRFLRIPSNIDGVRAMIAETDTTRARNKSVWLASLAAASLALPTLGFAAEETKTDTIGPWEIEATFKGEKFDRCSINRKLDDDIVASFVRTSDGLSLELESPNWKLDRGQTYPVKMRLGTQSFDTEVAAEPNSVSMDVDDEKFESGLRSASVLNVVAAGATIKIPLDKSSDAFERLEQCVDKNNLSVVSNPFVAPARRP